MTPEHILAQFSTHLKNAIAKAIAMAAKYHHESVTNTHLFVSIAEEQGGVGGEILRRLEVSTTKAKTIIAGLPAIPVEAQTTTIPVLHDTAKRHLERAMLLAYEREHTYVGTEHLLYALITSSDPELERLFTLLQLSRDDIKHEVEIVFDGASRFPDMPEGMEQLEEIEKFIDEHTHNQGEQPQPKSGGKKAAHKNPRAIDLFTTDLTKTQIQATIDPVIGREKEIDRLIHILCRRTKNNPVLVGEPGVGKTAIIEGLAKRISEGKVPAVLRHKKILSLDLTLLVAGTIYRGEFEARLKQLIDEVTSKPDTILFIDEIHNIIGAGSNQGTMDAANILKPALARGHLRCIGATTIDEYERHLKSDPALERRFQMITVNEPTTADTALILQGIAPYYESYHRITILPEAITTAVELSNRYIHDSFLPDKAIDLIDEACAMVRTASKEEPGDKKEALLLTALDTCRHEKEEYIKTEKLEAAAKMKGEEERLIKKLATLRSAKKKKPIKPLGVVARTNIIQVLANRLGISKNHLEENTWERLTRLPKRLEESIVGQDLAIQQITKTLERSELRSQNLKKPLASFLFVGPSGVGKTATAKALARALYHDDKSLVMFHMSEFAEAHSVSRILGSPAGYVGHKERNRFTDELKKRPTSVILFDEIDKAHPDVQKLLFQILDEGVLMDSQGKTISFRNAIIILTTNVGSEVFRSAEFGFGGSSFTKEESTRKAVEGRLKEALGSALLGRMSAICLFAPLTTQHIEEIIRRKLHSLGKELLLRQQFELKANDDAIHALATQAFSPETGARHIDRTIEEAVHDLLVTIAKKDRHKHTYTLSTKKGVYSII